VFHYPRFLCEYPEINLVLCFIISKIVTNINAWVLNAGVDMVIRVPETEQTFTDTYQYELIISEAEFFNALNCGLFDLPSLCPSQQCQRAPLLQ